MGLTFGSKRRHRLSRPRTLIVGVVVLALAAAGYVVLHRETGALPGLPGVSGPPALPTKEVDGFLHAWAAGDTTTMASFFAPIAVGSPKLDLPTSATSLVHSAPGSRASYTRTSLVRTKAGATATYHAHVDIAGFGPFDWNGTLLLVHTKPVDRAGKTGNAVWQIVWRPADLYPGLAEGQHLAFHESWPARAPIVAADGSLLAGLQPIVTIGLEPDRITKSLPRIKRLFRRLLGTDPAAINAALHGPGVRPNYFVPITTVPDDEHYVNVLRPQLAPLPGVFFHRMQGIRAATGLLSSQLVGAVGDITAERLKQLGPPYRVGDQVGLGGLQAAYETRLAGRPTGVVTIAGPTGRVRTLKRFAGSAPQPVHVTIDPHIQQAAESAMAGEALPAALVAIDTTTDQIRAVVSKPDAGFDRALDGAYPPGSTFKVITSAALLSAGRTGATPAPCPPTLTVDGRVFKNFEGEAAGSIDLAHAFAISCNNAFIRLADTLPDHALADAAKSFGFGTAWKLPLPSFGGSYPKPSDRAELAASAIGQGRVLASPVQMASVAAAVASGRWQAPTLTTEPAAERHAQAPLDPGVVVALRVFMAGVVQSGGTAAGAGLPPGVFAKTGTAEFGSANPPPTHAWFIGYRGTLAFAAIVEGGGVGGRVAAPVAARFLNSLAS